MNLFTQALASLGTTLRIMSYNKVGFAGFLMVVFIVLMSFIGPYFIPLDTERGRKALLGGQGNDAAG